MGRVPGVLRQGRDLTICWAKCPYSIALGAGFVCFRWSAVSAIPLILEATSHTLRKIEKGLRDPTAVVARSNDLVARQLNRAASCSKRTTPTSGSRAVCSVPVQPQRNNLLWNLGPFGFGASTIDISPNQFSTCPYACPVALISSPDTAMNSAEKAM
jgi:hypothetical protein